MRPQQQNRRMRGRNNNRKGPNPLSRNYESNGPDVKIRGSAQQVADKYAALARDALSSGDRVIAENYLQHAEHYNRIIAAAQAQQQALREERAAAENEQRENRDDEASDDNAAAASENRQDSRRKRPDGDDGTGPQPVIEGVPAEMTIEEQQAARKPRRRRSGNGGDAENVAEGETTEEAAPVKRTRRPRRSAAEEPAKGESADSAPESAEENLATAGE